MGYIIETKNLSKKFSSKFVVDKVNLRLSQGDIYGLIGKNGAGKTTLLKMILGLLKPDGGEIKLFDDDNLNFQRNKIGSLIESPGLYKNETAYENMLRFTILYNGDKNEIKPLLEKVGLGNVNKKKVKNFSLGMKQRLGIAISLINHPKLLILDEPINGLDPAGIKDIRDLIIELNKEGVSFLISSHLLDELAKIVNRYGIISNGILIEEISSSSLEEKCINQIRIKVDNINKASEVIKERFTDIILEVQNDMLIIKSYLDKVYIINEVLVKNNIKVFEITHNGDNMENYFIQRLGK